MKVIIDVEDDFSPKDRDILVYNRCTEKWECESTNYAFANQLNEINVLKVEVENYKNEVLDLKNKINTLTKIIKEQIK